MNPLIYKFIHLAGVMGLFTVIGTLIAARKDNWAKSTSMLHGISLLLVLLGGFGLVAKLYGNDFSQGWIIAKLIIWVLFGALLPLAKKQVLPSSTLITASLILGTIAAYLGIFKPF